MSCNDRHLQMCKYCASKKHLFPTSCNQKQLSFDFIFWLLDSHSKDVSVLE